MKFSLKIFFTTLLLICVTFSLGGYFLISSTFQSSLEREINLAREENKLLRFSFETAVLSVPGSRQVLSESFVQGIAKSIENNAGNKKVKIRISNNEKTVLYESNMLNADTKLLDTITDGVRGYTVAGVGNTRYVQMGCMVSVGDEKVYLESFRDISSVFTERKEQYATFQILTLMLLLLNGIVTLATAFWLTRPIQELTQNTRKIAGGDFSVRAELRSGDEIGMLAIDFNTMAEKLEQQVGELKDAVRRQTDFIGSFAHEIKTPLTSVIGYADMLRSKELTPEMRFIAADYIFQEGKRLENLSFKLLDLIVMKGQDVIVRKISMKQLFSEVYNFLYPVFESEKIRVVLHIQDAVILAEPDLLKTLLFNLLDNARKAMSGGGELILAGEDTDSHYKIIIEDDGTGMRQEETLKITEAFYMVDKARTRSQGGAGLGLSICAEIVHLHHGTLSFKSTPGNGTTVTVLLPKGEKDE